MTPDEIALVAELVGGHSRSWREFSKLRYTTAAPKMCQPARCNDLSPASNPHASSTHHRLSVENHPHIPIIPGAQVNMPYLVCDLYDNQERRVGKADDNKLRPPATNPGFRNSRKKSDTKCKGLQLPGNNNQLSRPFARSHPTLSPPAKLKSSPKSSTGGQGKQGHAQSQDRFVSLALPRPGLLGLDTTGTGELMRSPPTAPPPVDCSLPSRTACATASSISLAARISTWRRERKQRGVCICTC